MSVYALIVAAGRSERCAGAVPKQFRPVCGRPLLAWTISRFERAASIDKIVVVVAEENLLYTNSKVVNPCGFKKVIKIVPGGETRADSVFRGLNALPVSTALVAIHDGARPLVSPDDIDRVVALARRERAAMLARPATDTVKRVKDGYILSTLRRESLYYAQTPQVFQYDLILEAHKKRGEQNTITDDAMLIEAMGFKVRVVEPENGNMKVTTPEDLVMVEAILKGQSCE
ncbi:MAG: 2-C-methyl-D-erythritol 4-phosphate cytidylyltransferase [Candidatus Zixiibacteriota bacterium]